MDYPKCIVSNQKGESISIHRINYQGPELQCLLKVKEDLS